MSIYNKWEIATQYNFSTIPQGILPNTYKMVRLMSKSTYDMAMMITGGDVYARWRKIYPALVADGVMDDPAQYEWLTFRATNGEVVVLASPWIDGTSVKPVQFRQEQIILTNTTDAELQQVKLFLNALGASYTSTPM